MMANGVSAPRSLSSLADIVKGMGDGNGNGNGNGGEIKRPKAYTETSSAEKDTMLCKRVVTKDRRYITQITCFEKGQQHTFGAPGEEKVPATNGMPAGGGNGGGRNALRLPVFGKQNGGGGALASLFSINRQLGTKKRTKKTNNKKQHRIHNYNKKNIFR
jgi:hypothetical protein